MEFPPTETPVFSPNSPEYLEKVYEALGINTDTYAHLDPALKDKFEELIRKYSSVFWLPGAPLGTIHGFGHNIPTGDATPIHHLPYRKSPSELQAIKEEIQRMLQLSIIEPSRSAWGSPCILIRKPPEPGNPRPLRFVVDYRSLNAVTLNDSYAIPSVANILDALSGAKYFARLDMCSGYWQVPLRKADRHKTAFTTHLGLFQFRRLPFGLKTAGATFQRILNTIYCDYIYKFMIIYIDDLIIYSNSAEDALNHYELVLKRASERGIHLKPSKCLFFSKSLHILGH